VPYRSCSSTNYKKVLGNNIELAFRRLELEALEVGKNHADDSIISLFQNLKN
jgi:hypothetical protein